MSIDFSRGTEIELLEEVGKGIGRERAGVYFGGQRLEEPVFMVRRRWSIDWVDLKIQLPFS